MNQKNRISRREFLKTTTITAAAASLIAAGAGCSSQPVEDAETGIETPSYTYGKESNMENRVLIAYATRTGSTVDIAAVIGETLASQEGVTVDVKPMKDNLSIEGYSRIILGSAVQGANWLPEAVTFVQNHRDALNRVPVALFCVHIMNLGDDERSAKNRRAYLNSVRPLLQPVDEAFFAGMGMKPEETPAIVRWVYRTFKIGGEGDCRDWEKIRAWAETV